MALLSLIFYTLVSIVALYTVSAQQLTTNGLSIIDAPQTGSPGHAGGALPIAVEVTGNGQLSLDAADPSSSLDTHFISLEIFLVSSATNVNMTVASGPDFLTGETGSVRHLSFDVPNCIPAGDYNLTFYEAAAVDGEFRFTISPVAIPVLNANPSGEECTGLNELQAQPQADSWLDLPASDTSSTSVNSETSASPKSRVPATTSDPNLEGVFSTLTVTVGASNSFEWPTSIVEVTRTVDSSPKTVVVVSLVPVTTTITQARETVTSTFTETYTGTTVLSGNEEANFLPVGDSDSAERYTASLIAWIVYGLLSLAVFAM